MARTSAIILDAAQRTDLKDSSSIRQAGCKTVSEALRILKTLRTVYRFGHRWMSQMELAKWLVIPLRMQQNTSAAK